MRLMAWNTFWWQKDLKVLISATGTGMGVVCYCFGGSARLKMNCLSGRPAASDKIQTTKSQFVLTYHCKALLHLSFYTHRTELMDFGYNRYFTIKWRMSAKIHCRAQMVIQYRLWSFYSSFLICGFSMCW